MKRFTLRSTCLAIALLVPAAFTMRGSSELAQVRDGHVSGLNARITLPDGRTRAVKLEGVGCSASMCSRTAMRATAELNSTARIWLDRISAIKDTTDHDALLVMQDGSQRRISLLTDFRVLYFTNASGTLEKLDLAKMKSIEFPPLPR